MSSHYRALIPTQHASRHRTEDAAITALIAAQERTGLDGAVVHEVKSGTYRSTQMVWSHLGPLYANDLSR